MGRRGGAMSTILGCSALDEQQSWQSIRALSLLPSTPPCHHQKCTRSQSFLAFEFLTPCTQQLAQCHSVKTRSFCLVGNMSTVIFIAGHVTDHVRCLLLVFSRSFSTCATRRPTTTSMDRQSVDTIPCLAPCLSMCLCRRECHRWTIQFLPLDERLMIFRCIVRNKNLIASYCYTVYTREACRQCWQWWRWPVAVFCRSVTT